MSTYLHVGRLIYVTAPKWLPQSCSSLLLGKVGKAAVHSCACSLSLYFPYYPPSLKKAAALVNGLESGKFARLLSRVLQKLHLKVGTK